MQLVYCSFLNGLDATTGCPFFPLDGLDATSPVFFFLDDRRDFLFICFLDGDRWQLQSLLSLFSFSMKVQAPKAVEVDQRKRSAADYPY